MADNNFRKIYENFILEAEAIPGNTIPQLGESIADICNFFGIGRITADFFDTVLLEEEGKGHKKTFFDSQNVDEERFVSERRVTYMSSVVHYSVFQIKNTPDWDSDTVNSIHAFISLMFVLNGRSRLLEISKKLAFYDQDMNIHNLKYFFLQCEKLLLSKEIYGYTGIYLNLRKFSAVNMLIGRKGGNIVMKRYAQIINSNLSDDEVIARMGGDNFAILIKNEKLDRILDIIEGVPVVFDDATGEKILVSGTAGIYVIDGVIPVHSCTDVIDRMGVALRAAKNSQSSFFAFFGEEMKEENEKAMKVSGSFRAAIDAEEFLVYYQPKISVDTCQIAGAEALCRWNHEGTIFSPGDFVPILERGMDICRLDFYMLDHVCADIRKWLDEGKNPVKISVNLSRRHLSDIELLEHLVGIIDKHNVPHEYIEIELTETTTDVEFTDLKRVINGLRSTGISTSVDDFGVGYSSLTLIKDIPWDVLKVDKSFLPELNEKYDEKKKIMLKYVVSMAREMGLECVAEGVENRQQLQILRENCCDLIQGDRKSVV